MLSKIKSKKRWGIILLSTFAIIMGLILFFIFTDNVKSIKNRLYLSSPIKPLNGVYEPSAAQQLKTGQLIVLEDEISRALSIAEFDSEGNLLENTIRDKQLNTQLNESFDDLEAIAIGKDAAVYASTSFSRTSKGKQRPNREKLLRMVFDENGELIKKDVYTGFAEFLNKSQLFKILTSRNNDKAVDPSSINIEGLSFNQDKSQLLFGFKKPLVNDLSLIIYMQNPQQVLDGSEQPVLSEEFTLLNLQGGGIRSLFYDDRLQGYLMANEVNYGGGPKQSQLWFWGGINDQAPVALAFPEIAEMKNIEAITAVTVSATRKILIMSDDGSRKNKRPANYALIDYTDIESQLLP